jgi:hypothetical protein
MIHSSLASCFFLSQHSSVTLLLKLWKKFIIVLSLGVSVCVCETNKYLTRHLDPQVGRSSKWISYRVETFFGSCKSSTILDTFRHRRHSKITGNRWITLFLLSSVSNFVDGIYLGWLLGCVCVTRHELQLPHYNGSVGRVDLLTLHVGAPYCVCCCGVELK